MELIACTCPVGYGLPHDHYIGFGEINGVHRAIQDLDDVGHLWVDWSAFAKDLMRTDGEPVPMTLA